MADFVGAQYTIDNLKNAIDSEESNLKLYMSTGGNTKIVKSVQRGSAQLSIPSSGSGTQTQAVTISSVNMSKAIVVVSQSSVNSYGGTTAAQLTSSTELTLYAYYMSSYGSNAGIIKWQVIEFY